MSEAASGPELDNASEDEVVRASDNPDVGNMDLDSALANALKGDQSKDESDDAEPGHGEASADADDQGDEGGEPDEAEPVENAADAESGEDGDGEPEEVLSAPDHWPADKREAFDGLPSEAKSILLEQSKALEAQFTRKNQELSEQTRFADAVRREIEPFSDDLKISGLDEVGAIRQLAGLHKMFKQDPVRYLQTVAHAAGIDLSRLTEQHADHEYVDPQVAAVAQKVQTLEQQQRAAWQAQQHAVQQQAMSAIEAFAGEKDESGKPLRPHFDKVKTRMGVLLESGTAKDLADAYEQATWADPGIRTELTTAQQKAAAAEEAERRKQAVEKAKRAGKTPKPKAPPKVEAASKDLDSILDAAIEQYAD